MARRRPGPPSRAPRRVGTRPAAAPAVEWSRRDFAVPPATGTWRGLDLSLLDRSDEDERGLILQATEHPE